MNKRKQIANKIYALMGIILILSIHSCEDSFHEEEHPYAVIETYEDLEELIVGLHFLAKECFSKPIDTRYISDDALDKDFWLLSGGPGFTGKKANKLVDYSYYIQEIDRPKQEIFYQGQKNEQNWIELYELILSANNIIIQYENGNLQDEASKSLVGLAYFYRGYAYYRLIRIYNPVIYIDNINLSYTEPETGLKTIYSKIESDLREADTMMMPGNYPEKSYFNGLSNLSAKALLAEVYLSWAGHPLMDQSKYKDAAQISSEIIDSAANYDLSLEPDYANVVNVSNEETSENLFSIFGSPPFGRWLNTDEYFWLLPSGLQIDESTTYFVQDLGVSSLFYNKFPKDYRRDQTFINSIYVNEQYRGRKINPGEHYINNTSVYFIMGYKKYFTHDNQLFNLPRLQSPCNTVLIRYAHTLLTYAEASDRSGQLDKKAYDCVNMIRRRANKVDIFSPSKYDLVPGLNADEFADSVFVERGWEFCGEIEGYKFDLFRMNKLDPMYQKYYDLGYWEKPMSMSYFFPPVEFDVRLNPNLIFPE